MPSSCFFLPLAGSSNSTSSRPLGHKYIRQDHCTRESEREGECVRERVRGDRYSRPPGSPSPSSHRAYLLACSIRPGRDPETREGLTRSPRHTPNLLYAHTPSYYAANMLAAPRARSTPPHRSPNSRRERETTASAPPPRWPSSPRAGSDPVLEGLATPPLGALPMDSGRVEEPPPWRPFAGPGCRRYQRSAAYVRS